LSGPEAKPDQAVTIIIMPLITQYKSGSRFLT